MNIIGKTKDYGIQSKDMKSDDTIELTLILNKNDVKTLESCIKDDYYECEEWEETLVSNICEAIDRYD